MMPGVTYLPAPSITSASAGASTVAPTSAILPSRMSTLPLRIVGPAAVRIVTLRISVGRDGNGGYVLGNGSALGVETAPANRPQDLPVAARALAHRAPRLGCDQGDEKHQRGAQCVRVRIEEDESGDFEAGQTTDACAIMNRH